MTGLRVKQVFQTLENSWSLGPFCFFFPRNLPKQSYSQEGKSGFVSILISSLIFFPSLSVATSLAWLTDFKLKFDLCHRRSHDLSEFTLQKIRKLDKVKKMFQKCLFYFLCSSFANPFYIPVKTMVSVWKWLTVGQWFTQYEMSEMPRV